MAQNFRIEGVPALAVAGRYVAHTTASQDEMQGFTELLANTDELILRVRSERAAAKPASQAASKSASKGK